MTNTPNVRQIQLCLFVIMIIKDLTCVFDCRTEVPGHTAEIHDWSFGLHTVPGVIPADPSARSVPRQRCGSCGIKDLTCSGPVTLFDYHYTPLKSPNSCFLPCFDKNLLTFQSFTDMWVLAFWKKMRWVSTLRVTYQSPRVSRFLPFKVL